MSPVGAATHLPPEDDDGPVEYKRQLISPSPARFAGLVTQLNYRLSEGAGEALYQLGVDDDGTPRGLTPAALAASLVTLTSMADQLFAEASILRESDAREGRVAQVLVRRLPKSLDEFQDIRVAVAGNVDSGKSTLTAILSGNGALDNGRGLARAQVFSHRHELESGRTSSISQQIMGFKGQAVVNYTSVRNMTWPDIVERSSKILTLFDLAGHERYARTTVSGMSGGSIDYVMMVVNANMGPVLRMCKEHMQVALALKLPIFVVITKVDLAPTHIYEQTLANITKLLKSPGARKVPVIMKSSEDIVLGKSIVNDRIAPIFSVSNVTGEGLDLLRSFLNILPTRHNWSEHVDAPAEFSIDDAFQVSGVGCVVAGTVMRGSVDIGQAFHLGPDSAGNFVRAQVKSIHYKRTPAKRVVAGQAAALALKKIKRSSIRSGMVLLDGSVQSPRVSWEFTAEVIILYHGTTIREGYQPVLHCNCIRQSARIVTLDKPIVRAGDRAVVRFRWMYKPEFITSGSRIIFREGKTKGLGRILDVGVDNVGTSTLTRR
jgi:GTPase